MLFTTITPNCFTFATLITACTHSQQAASLHAHVVQLGCHSNNYVLSSLLDSYSKCGKLDQAILIYNQTLHRDVILLNSMIAAFSQNLRGEDAFQLFVQMRTAGQCPTDHTYSTILNSCATLTALQQGRQVHSLTTKIGSDRNVFVASSLVDMYSKCGNIDEARRIFDQLPHSRRNSILWTSMITAYAHCGRGADGLDLFEQLVNQQGMAPDNICFTAVLTACNHAGLVDGATKYFDKMEMEYGLTPQLDQYACMVDLYGKSGQLIKAKQILEEMPFEPNAVMWSSFLGSCRVYAQVDLGREAANHLFKMDPYNPAPYVTMANIYADAGMWQQVLQMRKLMRENGVKKTAGWSWIEVENGVHVFSVSDTSHPRLQDIYVELNKLTLEMMEAGYLHVMKYVAEDNTNECI
ncbi:Pentatricopeptide repeat-containing protein [Thalictrum thalictroides]|uniref:Pentatricopeptide repeat-containing protein n=1 Tax=Thalictrum thalictroides TaxID=46969 RepID=A0A7J6W0K7_THATH|nr:Pentatricopeptide repeat-containing protein [Thalictrum thalictroides]